MEHKFLKVGTLALLQIVIVGNLQIIPANALYGFSLPFLYLLTILGFTLPCALMVAELATTRPQTGGAYIWCEQAFGAKAGFVTVAILWLSNLLWYPSLFSLIAINFAYIWDPALAQNKIFVMSFGIMLFWLFTGLNCAGIRLSSVVSAVSSVIGIIFPMVLIIICALMMVLSGEPLAITRATSPLVPDLWHLDNVGYLISVIMTQFGIELTAVHAGNVVNPKRAYPLSLLISCSATMVLLLLAALAVAVIIPTAQLSVVSGLLDSLVIFFQRAGLGAYVVPLLALVFIGNVGSAAAWMMGSTRGLHVAAERNKVAKIFQLTNRYEAPVGVLLVEACIFTAVSALFLVFTNVTDVFWLLLDLASQITLVYYIILFCSAIRLRYRPVQVPGFKLPGGNGVFWVVMLLGIMTSGLALSVGFIAPSSLTASEVVLFHAVTMGGLIIALLLPFALSSARSARIEG